MSAGSLEKQALELAQMRDALREMADALGRLASAYYKAAADRTNKDKDAPG